MNKPMKFSTVRSALEALGFDVSSVDRGYLFVHSTSGTVVLFPKKTVQVSPQRVASLRRILLGREAATAKQFDEAFGLAPSVTSVA